MHAPVGITPQTLMTVIAGKDGRVDHPVAFLNRGAEGIGRHPGAQALDFAGSLMAHGPACRRQRDIFLIAAKHVEIRPANPGLGHAQ